MKTRGGLQWPVWLLVAVVGWSAGCLTFGEKKPVTTIHIFEQVSEALPHKMVRRVTVPKTGLTIPVAPYPSLGDLDVQAAELIPTVGGLAIMLRFNPSGIMSLTELTTRNRGRYLVVFLNGKPVSAWLCDRVLQKGQFLIEGNFTDDEARAAVDGLNEAARLRARR